MSEYFFGITKSKPSPAESKRRDKIARKHGGAYTEANRRDGATLGVNNGHYQGWFAIPNRGNPFDQQTAAEISAEVAGLS